MLVLSRTEGESITIEEIVDDKIVSTIKVMAVKIGAKKVRIGVEADKRFNIRRDELPSKVIDDGGPESEPLLRGTGTPDEEAPPVPHVPDLRRLGITTPLKAIENDAARTTETTAD